MRDEHLDRRTEEALARYLAVAPYLRRQRHDPGPSVAALSAQPIPWVGGTYRRRSAATLYRYLKSARERQLAGLYRQRRTDEGKRTAIPDELFALCCALRHKFPAMGSAQIIETLVAEGVDGAEKIAASTLRRWLREEHLQRRPTPRSKDSSPSAFVRWECSAANELWLADATPGVFLPNPERPGKFRGTQLLLLEDAFSRRVVGGGFYWNQQLPALDDSLFRATLAWGIPEQIYVDRGNIFVSRHFHRVCAELGVHFIHAGSPWAKGKIERLILTVQNATFAQLKDLVERGEVTDIEGLNTALWAWIDHYHERRHSQTGEPPAVRLAAPVRSVGDVLAHEQTFLWQASRQVRRAGCTLELFGNTYEVGDTALAGTRVQVRFNPYRLQTVAVWYEGRFRQTVTAGKLTRERHPQVSPLPERGPLPPETTLNQIAGLLRKRGDQPPAGTVSFARSTTAAPRLAEVLATVLGRPLEPRELQTVRRHWQHHGPFDPQAFVPLLERFVAQKGGGHHIAVYLDLCRREGDLG